MDRLVRGLHRPLVLGQVDRGEGKLARQRPLVSILQVGGQAIANACDKIIEKGKKIAAQLLEASEADIEFKDGTFTVAGTDRSKTIGEVVFEAYVPHHLPYGLIEPGMEETAFYDPENFVFPFGTHVAVVEVDEDTGKVELVDYVAVDDCGPQVNPMIVEGQLHGGIVQGVAQALWEEAVYDADGNLRNPTLMDYLVPSAAEMPSFQLDHTVTPSPTNELGVKGSGEAGTSGPPPTVINPAEANPKTRITGCGARKMPATIASISSPRPNTRNVSDSAGSSTLKARLRRASLNKRSRQ